MLVTKKSKYLKKKAAQSKTGLSQKSKNQWMNRQVKRTWQENKLP